MGPVRDGPGRSRFDEAQGGEVEFGVAARLLEAEDEAGLAARGGAEVAEADRLLREVAEARRGVGVEPVAGDRVLVFELELEAVVPMERLADSPAAGRDLRADGPSVPGRKIDFGGGEAALRRLLAGRHIDH